MYEDFEQMRYADSKDVLEKSHNLTSKSEVTVLPTLDSIFIKISRTPRSVVSLDKGASVIRIVRHCHKSPSLLRDIESLQQKVFTSIPLSLRQLPKYAAWICQRVGSSCGVVSDQMFRIYLYRMYFSKCLEEKNLSRIALRGLTRLKVNLLSGVRNIFLSVEFIWMTCGRNIVLKNTR